jgi:hypothetical protein
MLVAPHTMQMSAPHTMQNVLQALRLLQHQIALRHNCDTFSLPFAKLTHMGWMGCLQRQIHPGRRQKQEMTGGAWKPKRGGSLTTRCRLDGGADSEEIIASQPQQQNTETTRHFML